MVEKEAHMATATKCLTKVLKINMGKKENLFNNCADKNGFITTCRMKLDPFPSASTKIHSKWNKNLNVTHGLFLFGDYFCLYLGFIFVLIFRISHMHLCFDRVFPQSSTLLYPPPPPLLTWCFISCSFLFYSHCSQNVCVWVLGCHMGSLARVTSMWF